MSKRWKHFRSTVDTPICWQVFGRHGSRPLLSDASAQTPSLPELFEDENNSRAWE